MQTPGFPTRTLYHYTSISGLRGIVENGFLWATHVSYMNDAAELRYATGLLRARISERLAAANGSLHKCLTQLGEWLQHGFIYNHLVFACSFTANGNLLGQWRAYCPPGKGVSLGFNPEELVGAADSQAFHFARCIYRREEQLQMLEAILNTIVATADDLGEAPPNKRHPTQSYYDAFERHEDRLLNVAALIKHPAFEEEDEWRAISRVSRNLRDSSLRFRESAARLIPYIEFALPKNKENAVALEHVFVGPAPEPALAFGSIDVYLTNNRASPTKGLSASGVPWRPW